MGIKLKKIDRVPTSLKELIDVDSSTGITRCVDCISNGMILVADVPRDISKKDTFVFKNLTDIIKVGLGMQATLVNGIMTLSSSLESLNLNDLLDVSITNPADDDVLTYNSILQRWENTASGWVPTSRTISINGVIQDLSANRSWTISVGSGTVTSVTGTGTVSGLTLTGTGTTAVTLTLGGTLDVISALGFTPYNATNPAGYITTSALANYVTNSSLSSTLTNYVTSSTFSSTISGLSSVYQPLFVTDNGLTYSAGTLKLGGPLTGNTTIAGASGTYYLYLQRFSELKLNADNSSTSTEINLTPTKMLVKTPLYGTKTVGDVLTLKDAATGEVEFETPATGGDMNKSVYDIDNDGVVDKAETVQIVVRNSTGATLTKGQVVYLSGATGNRPNAVLADASTEATSSKTIGLVVANIANNADGNVAVNGTLHDLDTSAFTAGDTLWLSETAGAIQANIPPAEPAHAVFIGYVARSHPNQGRIVLAIQNGYELNELHGVLVPSPSNNDVLRYNTTSGLWEDDSIPTILGYTPANIASPAFTGTPTAPTAASGTNTTQIATTAFVQNMAVQSATTISIFGDGANGAATITGALDLTEDTYYTDLTVGVGGSINLKGYRLFVNGVLDLSNAGANAIYNNGLTGNTGSVTAQAGVRGGIGVTVSGYGAATTGIAISGAGGAGAVAGNAIVAVAGAAPTTIAANTRHTAGGAAGAGGAGGSNTTTPSTGAAGGAGQATLTVPAANYLRTYNPYTLNTLLIRTTVLQGTSVYGLLSVDSIGGRNGGGGGGGGASPAANGKSGGSGGSGGGIAVIYARQIIVGASTNAAAISARGGTGGAGGTSGFLGQSGGGGGGGGGGGYVYLVYGTITGGSFTFVTADGGAGGNGSNGNGDGGNPANGTGIGGTGGTGGNGGRITAISLGGNTITQVDGTSNAAATPTVPTTTAGSPGTAGGTCTFSS